MTLVTLPVYFSVSWPTAGYQPQEVDAVNLLGYDVRIRPTLEHFTYVFGDGTTFGPTTSTGGRYPDGDITRTYAKAGTYSTHVDITYGGEFSVNGGAWTRIPDTVAVPGHAADPHRADGEVASRQPLTDEACAFPRPIRLSANAFWACGQRQRRIAPPS